MISTITYIFLLCALISCGQNRESDREENKLNYLRLTPQIFRVFGYTVIKK